MNEKMITITPSIVVIILSIVVANTTGIPAKDIDKGSENTLRTILFQAANNGQTLLTADPESQLLGKEYENQLLFDLQNLRQMTVKEIALNVLILKTLDKNPKDFHSYNLVAELERTNVRIDIDIALISFALCVGEGNVSDLRMKSLIDIALETSSPHYPDTLSIAIIALRCLSETHQLQNDEYNMGVMSLLRHQGLDGAFGSNLYSTTLALQAFSVTAARYDYHSKLAKAYEYMMSQKFTNDTFVHPRKIEKMLSHLAGKALLNIVYDTYGEDKYMPSSEVDQRDPKNSTSHSFTNEGFEDYKIPKINITYTIWAENHEVNYSMSLSVPENTTFLKIMEIAAEKDQHFEFTLSKWPAGYYVYELADLKEDLDNGWYWKLYCMKETPIPGVNPDPKNSASVGVKDLIAENGDNFFFRYHQLTPASQAIAELKKCGDILCFETIKAFWEHNLFLGIVMLIFAE